ncbi:hypothetical protein A2276_07140 [candidate division WOR-1 bacterium RIFOXYA12_FULL_43_27]|uniref:Response regulatory domain-containing protein n=1 Tax=candidate division WOR-1 bacterium RIFOXYC2_FULL_46_14 TaxID=1802587 RepID=A0A1F4U515_UNCSA|nr:MAG: hypothetical protein A2276_07140 [candidate division WOR-1 bacterium RIFOXYA12_FULL_43_27]OGC18860.1 MAG: hypothetical protein A2292_07995 [candidate division WOR-1 bacterium RIFOXYB2_FULL_46_45]OGC29001.1 MAG: hypothetical protein A2232_03060 [candidate division WOR-1 bacterium RIFOXYA2_FULL_46_56]OGC39383.1 MAG: hypothetical protein A2438_06675 [candidate division WOR-1 bacterium RIFOXYC2_FULL_46_14]
MADKPIILVVDDEQGIIDNVSTILTSTGLYTVIASLSASDALQIIKKNQTLLGFGKNNIRLIISDIKMPEMDGLQFMKEVRLEYPGIGFLFLTAFEDREKRAKAREGKAAAYLRKPFSEAELLAVVKRFFDGKEDWMIEQTKWELLGKDQDEEGGPNK